MLKNNFSFNSPEKTSTKNTTLISDEKFISLINNLSDLIKEFYYISKNNLDEIFKEFRENNKKIIPQFYQNIQKQQKNLNYFIEQAKEIFKKMSSYKSTRRSFIKSNTNSNFKNLSNSNKIAYKENDYNSINRKNQLNTNYKKISKYGTEDDDNIFINNTYNTFNTKFFNKSDKKYSSINTNLENIKNLIQKLSVYENIISKVSLKSKENYKQLQNDIKFLVDKCIKEKGRNSLNNNLLYNNDRNNISINNGYDMNNYSFNFNNINPELPKKNLLDDFNIKNDYNPYDIKISDLKMKNNLYKEKIKDLEFQVEDLNSTIETLENTLSDYSNNKINFMKSKNDNTNYKNEMYTLQKNIKKNENMINNYKKEIKKKENDLKLKDIKLNNALKELEKMNLIIDKQKENSEKEITNLKEQIKEYEKIINSMKVQNQNNLENIKNNEIIENNKELSIKLNNEISELKNKMKEKEKEKDKIMNDLKEKISEYESYNNIKENKEQLKDKEILELKEKIKDYQIEINKNKNSLENINILLSKEKEENRNNLEKNNKYEKDISFLRDKTESDKIIIERNKEEVNKLKKEIEQKEKQIKELNDKLKDMNYQLDQINFEKNKINEELNILKNNNKTKEQNIEKEKLIQKIKEYKETSESNMQQIKVLKNQIKEMEGKNDNELLNKIKELENKLKYKNEQIEGFGIVINKLTNEREKIIMEQKKNNNISKISKGDNENELKEAKIIINNLKEKIKILEEENKNIIRQKEDSEYKSEGEEEYTMKKMVNATKKRNQSEDIKIDYPGLSNMKQRYDELDQKYRTLEENIIDLLSSFKCNEENKNAVINICNTLELGDDMIKQIIKENI